MSTSVWLFKPRSHGRKIEVTRRGEGDEIGPCRALLLVSCSRLGWLFSSVLAHDPVAEGGPQALAHGASIIRH